MTTTGVCSKEHYSIVYDSPKPQVFTKFIEICSPMNNSTYVISFEINFQKLIQPNLIWMNKVSYASLSGLCLIGIVMRIQ